MVDIDRAPDPFDLLAAFLADEVWRAERLTALTDAAHDIDAATTANYLVDPRLVDRAERYAEAIWPGAWDPQDLDLPEIAAIMAVVDEDLAQLAGIIRNAAELIALGWAVKKAKGRGEVEVLIANIEADAHRTQHEETTP